MNLLRIVKFAYSNIAANKRRSFLTMLGILIGVGSVITIMAVGAGAQSYVFNQIESLGSNLIGVLPGASEEGPPASVFGVVITTLTFDDAKELKKLPHVVAVTPYANGNANITHENKSKNVNYSGVTSDFMDVESSEIVSGRFISADEDEGVSKVAVLGNSVYEKFFEAENAIGQRIKIGQESFVVIGVLKRKGSSFASSQDDKIFVPVRTAQKILLGISHISFLRAKIDAKENIPMAMSLVKKTLITRHGIQDPKKADFTVRSMAQALDMIGSVTSALNLFLGAIAAISLIVGGVGIMNIMLVSVTERTREIGLRKAVGAKRSDILNQFILESVILTLIGGSVGIVLGSVFSAIIALLVQFLGYHWEFIISPYSVILSFSIAALVGVVFGYYPARRASSLNAIDALRFE